MLHFKIFVFIFFTITINTLFVFSQSKADSIKYYTVVDINPEFPGGDNEVYCFYDKNINKEILKSITKSGMVMASFIIDETGDVNDIKIIRSLDTIADNELLRIIKLMPKWKPGRYRGKNVPVQLVLPLKLPYINNCLSGK